MKNKPKAVRTTISLSDEAQQAIDWVRKAGIPLNVSKLCSEAIVSGVASLAESLEPGDLAAMERVSWRCRQAEGGE